jgi:preprotein translocase subunit SecE
MAKSPGAAPSALKGRPMKAKASAKPVVVAPTPKTAAPDAPRKKSSLPQFIREVRVEARKTTWTTWKETWITSLMVFIMVVITAIFFLIVDGGLNQAMLFLLNLAGKGA